MTSSPVSLSNVKSGATSPSANNVPSNRRAVGVVRVSRVGDRDGDRFVSPSEQAERIRTACEQAGLELRETLEEMNVSGGAPLDRRSGLRRAVELVESGEAEVVVVAYFDRLVRSLAVQQQVVERVENAGGAIIAVDVGEVRADTASRWLSSTMLGMVSEYHRRVTAERTEDAKRRAVARGVAPFPRIPPGYRRGVDGALEVHPGEASAVCRAFEMRARGATVAAVRQHLRENGITRSYHGTLSLLKSRVVLGELAFGSLSNPASHPAIVDHATWARVQDSRVSRGRKSKSDRLLARLGVLRCGTCGAKMVVGTSHHSKYFLYRCPPTGDCPRRVTIGAERVEATVIGAVQRLLEGVSGSASIVDGLEDARRALGRAEADLDAAVAAFSGLDDLESARARLLDFRSVRDQARAQAERLAAASRPAVTVSAGDWGDLTLDEQRALVVAVIDRVDVAPGRDRDRVVVQPRTQ